MKPSVRTMTQAGVLLIALAAVVGCGKDNSTGGGGGGAAVPNTGGTAVPRTGGNTDSSGNVTHEPGYTSLFDGRQLDGWRSGKEDQTGKTISSDNRFQAKDGVIVVSPRNKENKPGINDLVTIRSFDKDFVLKLEFRAAEEATGNVVVRGYPLPIGDFIRRNEQTHMKLFKNDGWNELEITVRQITRADGRALRDTDHLQASYVNGKAVAKLNGADIDPNVISVNTHGFPRVNGESMVQYGGFGVPSRGTVVLRANSGKLEFRNIRFKDLE